ncbi:MAG TPA: FtsX-like permease family protein [Thermoplasmata archaeon]|nr:FtsX-like permease family protein [Thermoplasmata archaeon]
MTRWRRRGARLRHQRLQVALAIAAIGAAVALPVVLLSVGGGVVAHELASLENAGYQITVSAPGNHGLSGAHALATTVDRIADVASASPVLSAPVDLTAPGGAIVPVLAEGVLPGPFLATSPADQRALFPAPLPLGDPTDAAHFANGTYQGPAVNDVLLSSPLAASLGVGAGARVALSNGPPPLPATSFTVTGEFGVAPTLLGPTAADAIVVPLSDLQLLVGVAHGTNGTGSDGADSMQVSLVPAATVDPATVRAVAARIQAVVPYYGVTSLLDEATQLESSAAILNGFYLALSSASLAIGLLFLVLVEVRRVEADRASIAIRRAVGLSGARITAPILVEALGLAAAGAAAGVAGGFVTVTALAAWAGGGVATLAGEAAFDPVELALLGVAVVALALPAAAWAARAALRLSVPEALR